MDSVFFGSQRSTIAFCTPLPKHQAPNGEMVYTPISPLYMRSKNGMGRPTNLNSYEIHCDGLEVGVARSRVAALTLAHKPPPEFVFFHDWDVLPAPDALTKLFFRARCHPGIDIFSGVYCCKHSNPPDPLIYTENGAGAFWNWKVGDLLTTDTHGIKAVHMGLTLIRTSLFERMLACGVVHGDGQDMDDEPFFLTVDSRSEHPGATWLQQGTEDIYFCDKAVRQMKDLTGRGAKIMVDTSVLAGHVDASTGIVYGLPYGDGPAAEAKWMANMEGKPQDRLEAEAKPYDGVCYACAAAPGVPCRECDGKGTIKRPYKIAVDIGAGGERRAWPGYVTFTTDIRADSKPDYIQDTRLLNLPDNHFDLVATCHHLEHIGRWDQDKVWAQMFKICRPGGRIEHLIPSLDWAAHMVFSGATDGHVYDVLYGAQEDHGYAREFNTHFFGYTKEIAKAMAESAGFVDVVVRDWRDLPDLKYTLTIVGRKPYDDEEVWQAERAKRVTEIELAKEAAQAPDVLEMPVADDDLLRAAELIVGRAA